MKSYERREKVSQAIKRELAQLLQSGAVKDDRLAKFISIVDVDLNESLSSAKVFYSVLGSEEDIDDPGTHAALKENAGFIRGIICRKINLKYTPKLQFIVSDSLKKSVDMVALIEKTVDQDDQNKQEREIELD